jgi:hypothetical protein
MKKEKKHFGTDLIVLFVAMTLVLIYLATILSLTGAFKGNNFATLVSAFSVLGILAFVFIFAGISIAIKKDKK